MESAGVPIVPGTTEEIRDAAAVIELGDRYGWPIAIKASAGGGGRGMEVVACAEDAARALETARRQGEVYFADAAVYDPDGWYSGSGSNFEIVVGGSVGAVMSGLVPPAAGLAQIKDKLQTLADTRPPV
jgi:hypothetical protein